VRLDRWRPVEFALFTGLRRGEVLDLTWERVDRARGVIVLDVTKSGKRREVPLNSRADAVLARRGSKSSGLVFGTRKWDRFRSAWECAVDRAKLVDFHFHDLRHTFASWAVQRGARLQEVKDLLGHHSLAMTLRFSASFSARDPDPGGAALEVAVVVGAPGRSRTCDPRIRSRLRGQRPSATNSDRGASGCVNRGSAPSSCCDRR
jgi:Phage integrase family